MGVKIITSKVKLIFFGGANEIGGNKVFLEDLGYNVKIFLDFGVNFKKYNQNFEYDNNPEDLDDLITTELFPRESEVNVKNLYSKYYIFNREEQKFWHKLNECRGKEDPPTDLDGVLISHSHRDHYYGLSLLNRNIPIYAGYDAKKLILAHYDSSRKQVDNFYFGLKWKPFRTRDSIDIKGLKIEPVHVDHSIPAAYGFIVYTSAGPLVYSGDFRLHGPLSWMTGDLVRKAWELSLLSTKPDNNSQSIQNRVKYLICEGTHIHKSSIESEHMVKQHLKSLFKNILFDFVLVQYDRMDWDRFRTFSEIAKKYGWKYIISEKDAYFYYLLNKKAIQNTMKNPNIKNDDHIMILLDETHKYPWQQYIREKFKKHGKGFRFVSLEQINQLNGKFFLYITSFSEALRNFLPNHLKGLFISSGIDNNSDNAQANQSTLKKKLLNLDIPSYCIHASGHAILHDIIKFINSIHPEKLFPIHTEHSKLFLKLFENSDIKVILPKYKEVIWLEG